MAKKQSGIGALFSLIGLAVSLVVWLISLVLKILAWCISGILGLFGKSGTAPADTNTARTRKEPARPGQGGAALKAGDALAFVEGLFRKGYLPANRNPWAVVYGLDDYPAALDAARKMGLSEYDFKPWVEEYVRRMNPPSLVLPVAVRWGASRRENVNVPMCGLKDLENLSGAVLMALRLAHPDFPADFDFELRPMRKPDAPMLHIVATYNGETKEADISPAKTQQDFKSVAEHLGFNARTKDVELVAWQIVC